MWSIARRYGMTVQELRRWNRIGRYLAAGQRLVIR
jgi:LysM repeat protein